MPWILTMKKLSNSDSQGVNIYNKQCLMCHATDYKGSGKNPTIIGLKERYSFNELKLLIKNGKGFMPGFSFLDNEKLETLTEYIYDLKDGDMTDLSVMNEEVFYSNS